MAQTFLLAWWKTGLELIGPFEDTDKAYDWAKTIGPAPEYETISNPNNPHDTPCWQVMELEVAGLPDQYLVRCRRPDSGPLHDYDGGGL